MEKEKKSPLQKYEKQWQAIEKMLNEGGASGYKIAVIETEKILRKALDDKNFPGKNIERQIENATTALKNADKLKYSRAMRNKIIKEPLFDISTEDAKEIIAGYYNAIENIVNWNAKEVDLKEKVNLFLQRHFYNFPARAKNGLALVFIFLLAVFLSTETSTGQSISGLISHFSQFIFYKLIPIILALVILGGIIIGGLYYWRRKS